MSPELKEMITLEQFKTSVDSFLEGVTSFDPVVEVRLDNLTERFWKDETGTREF